MKKSDFIYKTIQLILYIVITAVCLLVIIFDPEIFRLAVSDIKIFLLGALLFAILAASFIFISKDLRYFRSYKKNFRELDFAIRSDPLSGLANRFSCDAMIEKYLNKPLPEDLGCIMLDLKTDNVNQLYGHVQGNRLIKDFSNILKSASADLCFIGRNGGNKFMALFEENGRENADLFLQHLSRRIESYNETPDIYPIEYHYGIAFGDEESVKTITDLVSLANKLISENS